VNEEEGIVKGREVLTMDDRTQVKWVLGPSHSARRARAERVTVRISEPAESLRAKLITAAIDVAAEGSHPRLTESRHTRTAV
jgi:hypothetical protein